MIDILIASVIINASLESMAETHESRLVEILPPAAKVEEPQPVPEPNTHQVQGEVKNYIWLK